MVQVLIMGWPALFASRIFRFLHSLLQRIRSHGHAVAKMDIRTSRASIINTVSMNHFHCWAFRTPIDCQAIYIPSRKPHGLRVSAANLLRCYAVGTLVAVILA